MSDERTEAGSSETPAQPIGVSVDAVDPLVCPWRRGDWSGRVVPLNDEVATDLPDETDVAAVLAYGDDGNAWDGSVAGIARLHDGRFVAWETFYGPTGDGFSEDAYGGDADVLIADRWLTAWTFGLTNEGRRIVDLYP